MKIWLKYFIGIIIGSLAGVLLPFESETSQKILSFFFQFVIQFGRYMVVPVVFFSMTISVCKLREQRKLWSSVWKIGVFILGATLSLTIMGLVLGLIIKLPRIPISVEQTASAVTLNIPELLLKLFPTSALSVFNDGAFLLPLYILAGFLGAGCATDRSISKVMMNLFDSLSKVCYTVMCFFVDFFSVGFIALACMWVRNYTAALQTPSFFWLLLLLFIFLFVFVVGIVPLILKFVFREDHPYKIIYASLASLFASFFSGDTNLTLLINIRHGKESLGIKRIFNSVVYPIFSTFSRGGSSFVCIISFILILRSYSSLAISFADIVWIGLISFCLSFFLGGLPGTGPFVTLTVMCSLYGKGFETAYLLLNSVVPFLCCVAAAIDALVAMIGSYLLAKKMHMREGKETRHFI